MRSADILRDDLFCKFCGKQCKNINSLSVHQVYCKLNPNRKIAKGNPKKGRKSWNKGLTKFDSEILYNTGIKISKILSSEEFKQLHPNAGKCKTEKCELERRKKISNTMKSNPNAGGYRYGSGRGKKGWYKGIFCDSSWELAFVIYYLDHNLNIKRCNIERKYIFNDKEHKYIPDFITDDGIIEIKGYSTEKWKAKISQNPDIKVLYEKDMIKYINYTINKYGKNYILLYNKEV